MPGTKRATHAFAMKPNSPQPPTPPRPKRDHGAVDPDPKAHPIHRDVPPQPIEQGTDPKHPVTPPKEHR